MSRKGGKMAKYGKYKCREFKLRIPDELWEFIDQEREKRKMNRTEYIKYILECEKESIGGGAK